MKRFHLLFTALLTFNLGWTSEEEVRGWLNWRGPQQNGTSLEKGLPETWEVGGTSHLWDIDLKGRGTPVIADGQVYVWGYRGEHDDLKEVLACLDEATGKTIWEHSFRDFLSDIIYDRYSIGAPTIDTETGYLYLMTSAGLLNCFTLDGELRWQRTMMEQFGDKICSRLLPPAAGYNSALFPIYCT